MEKRFIEDNVIIESRANDSGENEEFIIGYAIRFNKWSTDMNMWGKPFKEKVSDRALDGVSLDKVIASVNHDFKVLARSDKGTLNLTIDTVGLKYELKVPKTTAGRDALEDVKNGNLAGSSFTFTTKEDKWLIKKDENEVDERTILKIDKLIELGPVSMPAYPDSTVKVAKRSYDIAFSEANKNKDDEKIKTIKNKIKIIKIKNKIKQ